MSLRTFSVGLVLLLWACSGASENSVLSVAPEDRIECALDGTETFKNDCALERIGKTSAVLRHADGGFRRIEIAADGTIEGADGSMAAMGTPLVDGRFELTLGGDRYRLPDRKP
ncbi:MAG: hypothetical protein ACKVOP_13025 [Sphingomonadaceae bacterium]